MVGSATNKIYFSSYLKGSRTETTYGPLTSCVESDSKQRSSLVDSGFGPRPWFGSAMF